MSDRDEFLQKIISAFKLEAEEILEGMENAFLELEKDIEFDRTQELLEIIYRKAHTLKGASRAVDILEIEALCQEMENIFSDYKSRKAEFSPQDLPLMHKVVKTIHKILSHKIDGQIPRDYDINGILISLQNTIIKHHKSERSLKTEARQHDKPEHKRIKIGNETEKRKIQIPKQEQSSQESHTETIRIATHKLDKILLQVEDLLSIKLSSAQVLKELKQLLKNYHLWERRVLDVVPDVELLQGILKRDGSIGGSKEENEAVANVIRYLHKGNMLAKKTGHKLSRLNNFWEAENFDLNLRIDKLLNDVKRIVTVPFSEVLNLFPKIVHDYCQDYNKQVKLIILGESLEIDRRILEKLKTPLIHLLRNCLDHGIEKPSVRKRLNKPVTGLIRISIEHTDNNRILFCIEDDGAGINLKKLQYQVDKLPESEMSDDSSKNLIQYIFHSGVSTSDIVTEFSGRGLGLAILKESVNELEGTIKVETARNKGTTFRIELPMSLVSFRGITIRAGAQTFVLPTRKIEKLMLLDTESIQVVEDRPLLYYKKEFIPVMELYKLLELKGKSSLNVKKHVVLIKEGDKLAALIIDGADNEQEILAKSFNSHLKRVRNVAGATILGSGKVVPILNPGDLVKSVYSGLNESGVSQPENEETKHKILVVEDSITSRMLLKNILENAGYEVETAFDGQDGYTKAYEGSYNLIISDVDMPRMSGFDMTAKLKSTDKTSDIPVIIVTSLNRGDDLEKGKAAGADGYIVKSNFAQGELTAVISKLIQERN